MPYYIPVLSYNPPSSPPEMIRLMIPVKENMKRSAPLSERQIYPGPLFLFFVRGLLLYLMYPAKRASLMQPFISTACVSGLGLVHTRSTCGGKRNALCTQFNAF